MNIKFKISITNMKKIVTLLMLVTLTSVSAQQSVNTIDYKTNFNSAELLEIGKTILDPVEKHEFYKHLFVVYKIDELRGIDDHLKNINDIEEKGDEIKHEKEISEKEKLREKIVSEMLDELNKNGNEEDELRNKRINELRKLPNPMLYDFVKKHLSKYTVVNEKPISLKQLDQIDEYEESTLRDKLKNVDKLLIEKDSTFYEEFSRLIQPSYGQCGSMIEDFNKNIITVYADCGTGASVTFNYILFKDNTFIDLGTGFGKLTKSEFKKLEKIIKKKVKDYTFVAARSGANIIERPNGNFIITFRGYVGDEAYASGGSIEITYETKDLKTFIPNSVTVEKLEWQSVGE